MKILPDVAIGPTGRKILEVAERYPKIDQLYVTSGYREEPGSHHNGLFWDGSPTAALDFGGYDDPEPDSVDQADMRDFAKWLQDNFAPDLAELIHTTPFNDDDGFYIQHGHRTSFDSQTMRDHLNHVHVALSAASAERILAQLGNAPTPPPPTTDPARSEVWGWDASNWDWDRGPMDMAAASAAGISFFVHKATEGTTYHDEYYVEGLNRARSARIPVLGAYHALWPGDPIGDARAFFDHVDRTTPWWREVPWIWQGDFEKFGPREPNRDECIAFLDELKRLTKGKGYVIGYAPRWLYGNALDPFPYDFWASNYTGSGAPRPFREQYQGVPQSSWDVYSGRSPRILQFASDAITGTQPTTCADRFNGTLAELIALTNVATAEPSVLKPAASRTKPRTARQPATGRSKPRTTKKQPSGEPVGTRRKGMTAGPAKAAAKPAKKSSRPGVKATAKKKSVKSKKA